jgi:hypothetical protein
MFGLGLNVSLDGQVTFGLMLIIKIYSNLAQPISDWPTLGSLVFIIITSLN